ncbi:VOC family protein [Neomicrococcus lactis]
MTYKLATYLNFENTARQAMEFYHSVLGGKLDMNTFSEFGMSQSEADANLIMHAQLETADGAFIMGSDTPAYMEVQKHGGFSIALFSQDYEGVKDKFDALAAGGQILEPLMQAPWGDYFGMFVDQFGINWMFNVAGPKGETAAE